MTDLGGLNVVSACVFHGTVTLALAAVVTQTLVAPWVASKAKEDVAHWLQLLVVFVVLALAFTLREHVLTARGAAHAVHAHRHGA